MKLRHFLTASIFGIALAAAAPASATSSDRAPDGTAPAAGLAGTIHQADWRGGHRARRAERRHYRRHERRAKRHRQARRHYRRHYRRGDRHYRRDDRYYRRHDRRARRHYRRDHRPHRPFYRRGGYLPHHRYRVIDNWYDYGWRRPYRGERYVYIDGRYLLVQVATGLIISALLY